MVGSAPAGDVLVGHGDKVHILRLQSAQNCLLGKPQDVLEAQVRLHVVLEHLDKIVDLGDVLDLQELIQHGLQECLLGLDTAQVAVRVAVVHIIVMAIAQHAHGALAVQQLIALADMDGQILVRIVIVHVPGHIEPDPAHGVHDLANSLPLDDHLVVRLKAHQLGNLFVKVLDAAITTAIVIVDGVDSFDVPGHVDHSVPGNGHDSGLLVGHIIAGQQHRVRVAAAACITA